MKVRILRPVATALPHAEATQAAEDLRAAEAEVSRLTAAVADAIAAVESAQVRVHTAPVPRSLTLQRLDDELR